MELNLEQLVKERIEEMDLDRLVKGVITGLISDEVRRSISAMVREKVDGIIADEIKLELKKGVRIDDGYGGKVRYDSFEDMFRKTFAEKMKNTWDIQRKAEEVIKGYCSRLFKDHGDAFATKLATDILNGTKAKQAKDPLEDLPL